MIWFAPEMSLGAVPEGWRGRQQNYSDNAFQTCVSTSVLSDLMLKQNTGSADSLLDMH